MNNIAGRMTMTSMQMSECCEMNEYNFNYLRYDIIKYFVGLGISLEQIRISNFNEIEIDLSIDNDPEPMVQMDIGNAVFQSYGYSKVMTRLAYTDTPLYPIHRLVADSFHAELLNITNLENFPLHISNHNRPINIDLSSNKKLVDISGFPSLEINDHNRIYLTMCTMLKNLHGLPKNFTGTMYLNNTSVESLDNIPRCTTALQLSSTKITSLRDISEFQQLNTLKADNLLSYENIINILLCEKLKYVSFVVNKVGHSAFDIELLNGIMNNFNDMHNKSEYMMDCSLSLIEHGFEKYI